MTRQQKLCLGIILLFTAFLMGAFAAIRTHQHWWLRNQRISVYIDGVKSPTSCVYLSLDGRMIIKLREEKAGGAYIIHNYGDPQLPFASLRVAGMSISTVADLGPVLLCSDPILDGVVLDGSNIKADYFDAQLKLSSKQIAFNVPHYSHSKMQSINVCLRTEP